ncbi:MAG: hypothetical protein WCP89_02965 [archaeon]
MALNKSQLIGYAAIIVIVISLASIGMKFTGFITTSSTGVVNVTITPSGSINFTTNFINFGSGSVTAGNSNATVNTEGVLTGGTGWNSSASNFTLENIGNVNVSLALKVDKNATSYLGGTSPSFKYRVINDTEPLSCVGNTASSFTEFTTTDAVVCNPFPFDNAKDSIRISIQLVIPSDSLSGAVAQTALVTATGTY